MSIDLYITFFWLIEELFSIAKYLFLATKQIFSMLDIFALKKWVVKVTNFFMPFYMIN